MNPGNGRGQHSPDFDGNVADGHDIDSLDASGHGGDDHVSHAAKRETVEA